MAVAANIHMTLRRSRVSDAVGISKLTRLGSVRPCIPPTSLFPWKTVAEFTSLIERSVICITAISTITGKIAGFICLDDTPQFNSIPCDTWEETLQYGNDKNTISTTTNNDNDDTHSNNSNSSHHENNAPIAPYNTLWVKSVLAPPSSAFQVGVPNPEDDEEIEMERKLLLFMYKEEDVLRELLATALHNSPSTKHILIAFPSDCSYSQLEGFGRDSIPITNCSFKGSALHILSSHILPQLTLRLGIMEDYDDFVPELLEGNGLITALPEEFFLDEILKDQDPFHKVIIAEDAITHRTVGLMCLEATIENQQMVLRQYATETFGKFRPVWNNKGRGKGINISETPNIVKIYFFHIDTSYALSAMQFIPFIFQQFPYVEYAMIQLPYAMEEPPFLRHFENVPLRKYQPRNAKGDLIPPPEGLWITCRYALDPVKVETIRSTEDVESVSSFLEEPLSDFSQQHIAALLEDISIVTNTEENTSEKYNDTCKTSAYTFTSRTTSSSNGNGENSNHIIGVASVRRTTVDEMYSLRANYDLDIFVNYYTEKPRDYSTTDITLTPEEGRRKFFRSEMPGILVRSFYVKSVYRCHVQLFLRELLRYTGCEVALVLGDSHASPFVPLLRQMSSAPPRRVQEKKGRRLSETSSTNNNNNIHEDLFDGKDVAALGCLFLATRRLLGDRKKLIHTRVIVVGAGSTALGFIYRLLSVPYACFTNIVLISTDGMPLHPNQQPHLWGEDRMELLEREHMGLVVGTPIRVVQGSVVDVDTALRYVSVDDGTYEPYDYVILTTGRQYVVSPSICRMQQPALQQSRGLSALGTLALSGESAVERLRQHLHELDRNPQNISNIIVYGSGMDAFAVATSIVNLGFSPQRIVVVSPEVTNPFLDKDAFDCIEKMWNSLGTNTLRGYHVTRMEYDDDGNALTTVVISPLPSSNDEHNNNNNNNNGGGGSGGNGGVSNSVELSCSLIVCCEDKDIDSHVLSTLNRRSIVFDGRVIVEANYRTTDKRVYAAGPVAMFTRRYGTTPSFDDFNARDVGMSLAEVLLGVLGFEEYVDPNLEELDDKGDTMIAAQNLLYTKVLEENGSRGTDLRSTHSTLPPNEYNAQGVEALRKKLPVYNSPLVSRIRLPGDYIFFCCRCVNFDPSECLRLCYSCIVDNKPMVPSQMELNPIPLSNTEEVNVQLPEQDLFVIYVNEQTHYIDAIVYFGNSQPEIHHYICLVGMPQSLLNLLYRYNEAKIQNEEEKKNNEITTTSSSSSTPPTGLNLMKYLRTPKLQIIFYDRFIQFYRELRERMRDNEEVMKMKARVLNDIKNKSSISEEKRKIYLDELTAQRNAFTRQVQYEFIKFLHESKDYLPQILYLPDISSHVKRNAETSA